MSEDPNARWTFFESKSPWPWVRRLLTVGGGAFVVLFVGALFLPVCGCSTRVGAYHAGMKSDLKNLASQQEIYFSDAYSYTTVVSDLAFVNSNRHGVAPEHPRRTRAGGAG